MKFEDMTLVQGLESILVEDEFQEGIGIVATLEKLITEKKIERVGKVATIISERMGEPVEELKNSPVVEGEASSLELTPEEGAASTQSLPVEEAAGSVSKMSDFSNDLMAVVQRIDALPPKYVGILAQLVSTWEKQNQ